MKKLVLACTLLSVSFIFFKCDYEFTQQSKSYPEELTVKQSVFNVFYVDLVKFNNQLSLSQKQIMDDYIKSLPDDNNESIEGKVATTKCECLPNQSTCSASGVFTDCCICCPANASSVCGVIFGIGNCRCETLEELPPAGGRTEGIEDEKVIKLNPRGIKSMFDFASKNKIDVTSIIKSLDTLVTSVK